MVGCAFDDIVIGEIEKSLYRFLGSYFDTNKEC
jgi:hypothetical protein